MNDKDKILGTIEISHTIENIIQNASKILVIVSPYLKITDRIKAELSMRLLKLDNCFFIFRKDELKREEREWMNSFANVHLIEVQNLHAKIYLNENICLLTSMNFYEYSQINNFEIGITIDRNKERQSYIEIISQVLLMTKLSQNSTFLHNELEVYLDYSVGKLFNELRLRNRRYAHENHNGYIEFCNDARKTVKISDKELYEDKTAILRCSNLGKERYLKIYNALK